MTSSNAVVLAGAVFLASAVEMVEALTIVVAVGHTEGWRAALRGLAVALVTLAVLVAAVGPALAHFPLVALRLVVGSVLFIFAINSSPVIVCWKKAPASPFCLKMMRKGVFEQP